MDGAQPTGGNLDAARDAEAIEAARKRRRALHAVLVEVERSVARPAPGRAEQWFEHVRAELGRLHEAFEEHVEGTEKPHGLYEHILAAAPRLSTAVRHLRDEHVEIRDSVAQAVELAAEPVSGEPDERVAEVREVVTRLIGQLSRHRQQGSDLVYEAFESDIGGVD